MDPGLPRCVDDIVYGILSKQIGVLYKWDIIGAGLTSNCWSFSCSFSCSRKARSSAFVLSGTSILAGAVIIRKSSVVRVFRTVKLNVERDDK